ncbi:DUF1963 domain-containing protein [Nonomuraea sp. B12E4]|uniref:DUF1963 domain-containing protein n=1 Tax=Nonomuraea sp. B12E4 TaxID=3153564 RepID=UPI00325F5822
MEPASTLAALHEFCAERLGAELATHFMKLARPGFALTIAAPGAETGHSRFGGRAMLEPGTPWPSCDGFPLSLVAVLDTDALPREWLGDLLPDDTGLLNFFTLDTHSAQRDSAAFDVWEHRGLNSFDPDLGKVIAARSAHAAPADPPDRSGVFTPVAWTASPGFAFPNQTCDLALPYDLGPEAKLKRDMLMSGLYVANEFPDWEQRPGALDSEDLAFGWPDSLNSLVLPDGADFHGYHHLLQLSPSSSYEWGLGADGVMHWSMPTEALRTGDFGRAIPTPDLA